MAKKRAKIIASGASICSSLSVLDKGVRLALAFESLCDLACELLIRTLKDRDTPSPELYQRYMAILATADNPPDESLFMYQVPMKPGQVLFMCLDGIGILSEFLESHKPADEWPRIRAVIEAWKDAWGTDVHAKRARRRFAALTRSPSRQRSQHLCEYLHKTLAQTLAAVSSSALASTP